MVAVPIIYSIILGGIHNNAGMEYVMKKTKLVAINLMLFLSGCITNGSSHYNNAPQQHGEIAAYHVLEWEDYDYSKTSPNEVVYLLDNKQVGIGEKGIEKVKSVDFPPGTVIRIKTGFQSGGGEFPRLVPYSDSNLEDYLLKKGYILEIEEKMVYEDKTRILIIKTDQNGRKVYDMKSE
jgi:hypothetical protein